MVQSLKCPDASRWQALLGDSVGDCAADLEVHLADCPPCQRLLDDLAVGSSGWLRDANRLAAKPVEDMEMTKTLHRIRDGLLHEHVDPPVALDFLTPSDQPGILGTLGRYQVLEVLGRGAFGIVLKALDPDLLRPVAIKVIAPYLAPSGTARQRFLREARAAAAVSHDHIVTIHAVETGESLPYIVMEYVTGISLQQRIDRDGPLAPAEIARIGLQTANGLAAAHSQGLVHRDIKPANILLENGVERVKITDFGLARAADDARLTQSGVAAGTPLYMSPEQARGDAVDHRSDLFSLGSVLYTLATGFPPFRADSTMGVLNRITNNPPRPIRETTPDFPADLEKIIMQLLEKEPGKRFQIAADVSFRLGAFLSGSPAPSEPVSPAETDSEPEQEQPTKWWVTTLCVLAGIAVVAIVLTFRTPKGTLIVEVDDPAIKVALDGEELKITGAGPQEVRLKPGDYHVTASKDGKPAKVSQEIVTITKDGKQVVKVSVSPGPAAGDVETKFADVTKPALPVAVDFGHPADNWETRQKKLIKDFNSLLAEVGKTRMGSVVLTTPPNTDPAKAAVGLNQFDVVRVKRLLVLRDQFAAVVPKAQKDLERWEKAKLDFNGKDELYKAGTLPGSAMDSANLELKQAERALKTNEETMAAYLADLQALAKELGVAGVIKADDIEVEFKKVMSEYEALVLRLAKNRIGRILALVEPGRGWSTAILELNGVAAGDQEKAGQLLGLRSQILTQAEAARVARFDAKKYRAEQEELRSKLDTKKADEYGEMVETVDHDFRVRTAAISSLVNDLKALADDIDPPEKKTEPRDPRFERVRFLRERIEQIGDHRRGLAESMALQAKEEKNVQDLQKELASATDQKAKDALKIKLAAAEKYVARLKDEIVEIKARPVGKESTEELQKELDKLRKELDGERK
jgi:signal transduction histidine kinase